MSGPRREATRGPDARAYHAAVRALSARGRFGVRLGLGRTRALLHALGDPQRSFRGALVGGTNGKGSVLALAGSALAAAGVQFGATPKPHLVSYRERLAINGEPIDPGTFARLVGEVLPLADRVARRHGDPTEFELLTAIIFRWFAESGVSVALVEVGLGGRLDATHVWDGGVAVITNVALDHMDRLGATIPLIAREKAAIIERDDLAVTGAEPPALDVIRRRARRVDVHLREVDPAPIVQIGRDGIEVILPTLGRTQIGLRGRHQAANVAIADATLDALEQAGIAMVGTDHRRLGYGRADWPGRLELIRAGTLDVLLDGAHNPAGARALAAALDDLRPFLTGGDEPTAPPLTLVMASMGDKDTGAMIRSLLSSPTLLGATIICTSLGVTRALPAADLAALWHAAAPDLEIVAVTDPGAALDLALRTAPGPVIVAGSLYLVGDARRRLVDDPRTRDPEVLRR